MLDISSKKYTHTQKKKSIQHSWSKSYTDTIWEEGDSYFTKKHNI